MKAQLVKHDNSVDTSLRSMMLCLGGFHLLMSFLGCIGHLMSGTGLKEILKLVYAPNTVLHMLSGKAGGHFLIDAVNRCVCRRY